MTLHEQLTAIYKWICCNEISLNVLKTHDMIFTPRTRTVSDINLYIDYENINTPESIHIFQRVPNYLVGARSSVGLWRLGYGVPFSGPGVAGWVTCPITIKLAIVLMNGLLLWVRQSKLLWHHNGRDGVSKYQTHDCLFNRLYRRRSKKNLKAPRHWPFSREFTGDRWISRTKGQ